MKDAMKFKQLKNIKELKRGTIVRHKSSSESILVDMNCGHYAIGFRTVNITNPDEWLILNEK